MKSFLRQQDMVVFIFISATFYLFTYLAGSLNLDTTLAGLWESEKDVSRSFGSTKKSNSLVSLGLK
ncbi:MAG: hypothetical protein KC478_17195 [Bacteriovoracaceae bacterium]|nr:hypothetical protein [Bacteriovoracaceae bacterium]